ncbi:universal stress protein [Ahrensia kielensis]|uniref:Universal stress protein n=1 Tax=Ahrensia kielensis TaxID=76980 RepID=A0ABU9T645_9HYPH
MLKNIMCPIDGSDCSFRALQHAAQLAKHLNAQLTVLIVVEFVVGRKDTLVNWDKQTIQSMQDQANQIATAAGVLETNIIVEKSRDVSFTIVDCAIEKDMDLIVMGASGKGGFKSFMLGSISNDVVRKSACPVTIVH